MPERWTSALKNVIVLSTKGKRSVANMMSGGDFDGDEAWVCWDERIVAEAKTFPAATFTEAPASDNKLPEKNIDYAHVVQKPPTHAKILSVFYQTKETFRDLGILSNWHMLRADWSPSGVLDRGCLEMAELLSALVDASKTGQRTSIPIEYRECLYPEWWPNAMKNVRKSSSLIAGLYASATRKVCFSPRGIGQSIHWLNGSDSRGSETNGQRHKEIGPLRYDSNY